MDQYDKFYERCPGWKELYPLMHWIGNGMAAAVTKMAFGNALGCEDRT